jgi:glutathione peroxidase
VFDKVDVNGPATHPVFAAVKAETGVPQIKGNFNKFIVDRAVLRVFLPKT